MPRFKLRARVKLRGVPIWVNADTEEAARKKIIDGEYDDIDSNDGDVLDVELEDTKGEKLD